MVVWAQEQHRSSELIKMLEQAQQMQRQLDPALVRASLGEIERDQGLWNTEKGSRFGGKLLNFDAFMTEDGVEISWATEDEIYSQFFVIERKQADGSFASIALIDAAGTHKGLRSYHMLDSFPKDGLNVYRLRQEDLNGSKHISKVRLLEYQAKDLLTIKVGKDEQFLSINSSMKVIKISIADISGKIVASSSASDGILNSVDIRSLKPGQYMVRVDDGHQVKQAAFVKKK